MTVREAAKTLNVTTEFVWRMLGDGRLEGEKDENGVWIVSPESVAERAERVAARRARIDARALEASAKSKRKEARRAELAARYA